MIKKYDVTGVILAGGKSSRMGFDKELIPINNNRLIDNLINTFNKLFSEVIVVSNHPEHYQNNEVIVIQDILESKGPLIGLHTALNSMKNNYAYIIACDMPNISEEYIHNLIALRDKKDAYVVKDDKYYQPFHGLYHKRLLNKIEKFSKENTSFNDFIKTIDVFDITNIEEYGDIFFNINTPNDLYHLHHKNDVYSNFKVQRHFNNKTKNVTDYVIDEYPLMVYLNNVKYVTLLTTPKNIKELVVGYLRSEKVIDTINEITKFSLSVEDNKVEVTVDKKIDFDTLGKDRLLVSGCGVGTKFHESLDQLVIDSIDSTFTITEEDIFEASTLLNNQSSLFQLTGGVHSCLFMYNNESIYFEDIGRHNAVDKVVGHTLINNIDTLESFIFSSGRISSDMLLKCALAKIPIIISRSAPTSLAVTLARKYGITLIGFARGSRFNIYSHSFRIQK